jgi:NAD(P)-dependent dehydrogenase (short-subunit alcohol dehydrogenase family)
MDSKSKFAQSWSRLSKPKPAARLFLPSLSFYTYWTAQQIRVIAIAPDGVFAEQPQEFTSKLHQLIPMGRLANEDEYEAAILFLCSDPSSYMTGHNLIVDGGRSVL